MLPFEPSRKPTIEDNWRGIILFGQNTQSYKFALAQSLLELNPEDGDLLRLEDLAPVYAKHLTEHLKNADKQGVAGSSKFLDACRSYNSDTSTYSDLVNATVQMGFKNVIDAFHRVNRKDVPYRFFEDERKTLGGIRITENFSKLEESPQFQDLSNEAEARWRLVETAWELRISRALVAVEHDPEMELLFTFDGKRRRKNVTSTRDALNGYQKGYCFYCFEEIHLDKQVETFPDVDHFFPHTLKQYGLGPTIDGVWNLVLACKDCNRGIGGKFGAVPTERLLARLYTRNEFLIGSNHPLKETLMRQSGGNHTERQSFLQDFYNKAWAILIHQWEPPEKREAQF